MMIVIKVGFDNNDNDGDDSYIDGQDRYLWMLMMMITEQMIMIFKMIMSSDGDEGYDDCLYGGTIIRWWW